MKTRLCALLVLALTALALLLPQSASATHSWSRPMLSRDGHHWTTRLDRPLFGQGTVLVPGDAVSRTFYVRNPRGEATTMKLAVRVHGRALLQRHNFRMSMRTTSGHTHWRRIRHTGRQNVARLPLGRDRMVRVTVRVRLLPQAGNKTMDGHVRFGTRVRLFTKR